MKYIILAAGRGTRLYPLTKIQPKCLFKLNEKITVIERIIKQIKKYDSDSEIIVVTGFMKEKIKKELKNWNINFIENPFYEVTNSIASLWFVKELLTEDTIILNSDIVISEELAQVIFGKKIKSTTVLLDSSIKIQGDYNVQISNEKVVVMSKELREYYGEYVGITLLKKEDLEMFKVEMNSMIDNSFYDQWYENVLVQLIFNQNFRLEYFDVSDYEWTEVDEVNDLIKAKRIQEKE